MGATKKERKNPLLYILEVLSTMQPLNASLNLMEKIKKKCNSYKSSKLN